MSLLVYLVTRCDWWSSVVCPRSMRACDSIGGNAFVSALPRVPARAHYFALYLTVTVHIRTLESIFPVLLAGSLIWWDSP